MTVQLWQAVDVHRDGTLVVTLDAETDGLRLTMADVDRWETKPVRITHTEALQLRDALNRHLGAG